MTPKNRRPSTNPREPLLLRLDVRHVESGDGAARRIAGTGTKSPGTGTKSPLSFHFLSQEFGVV